MISNIRKSPTQMLFQVRRWLPEREIIVLADSSYAVVDFLYFDRKEPTFITRLRLDAGLYKSAPERIPKRPGLYRKKEKAFLILKMH